MPNLANLDYVDRVDMPMARLPDGSNPDRFAVTLRTCPARRVAYIRVHLPLS